MPDIDEQWVTVSRGISGLTHMHSKSQIINDSKIVSTFLDKSNALGECQKSDAKLF